MSAHLKGGICPNDGTMYVTEMSGATLCISHIDANGQKQLVKNKWPPKRFNHRWAWSLVDRRSGLTRADLH